ncbi:hypothetical protein GWK47_046560 [Chionoecetes opilio]|uniref:Uncharacterized protein n=1 Tax=Chionoecetes opilio TaxID=41210 RepID=A0A8J5CWB3_CHIOP|nr:hypothetical protein GWK47_046560 [Chionoecetes opilio]
MATSSKESALVEAEREVVLCASAVVESVSVVGVKEAEVKTSVVEGRRRVEGKCSEGCGVALKTILEAIEDLKRSFASEVNDVKSVVKKQEIEIRSLKCEGEGPSGVNGGAHARDVPGGVPERDVTRATTKVPSKSPGIGVWKLYLIWRAGGNTDSINKDVCYGARTWKTEQVIFAESLEVLGMALEALHERKNPFGDCRFPGSRPRSRCLETY